MTDLSAELLALIQSVREATGVMNNGLFYVIEWPQPVPNAPPTWWDGNQLGDTPGRLPFTENIHQAIQFGSRDQAQRVLNLLHLPPSLVVSEHLWMGEARFEAELARRLADGLNGSILAHGPESSLDSVYEAFLIAARDAPHAD